MPEDQTGNALQRLYDAYPNVITLMPLDKLFSSHEFIQKLTQSRQAEYIEALYRQVISGAGGAPFKTVHGMLAKQLHRHCDEVELVKEDNSRDIFGDSVRVAWWRRRSR